MKKFINNWLEFEAKQRSNIYFYLLFLVWISFLLPTPAISSISTILFFIYFLVHFNFQQSFDSWKQLKMYFLPWLFFVFCEIISFFYSQEKEIAQKKIVLLLPFLLFLLLIFALADQKIDWKKLLKKMAYATYVFLGISFLYACFLFFVQGKNHYVFFGENLSGWARKHNAYASFYLNISFLILSLDFFENKKNTISQYIQLLIWFLISLIFMILLGNRIAFLAFLLVNGFLIFKKIFPQLKATQKGIFLAILLLVFTSIPFIFPTFYQRIQSIKNITIDWENQNPINNHFGGQISEKNWEGSSFRLAKWICAWDQIQQQPIFGYGIGDAQKIQEQAYEKRKFHLALEHHFSPHNQYLLILLEIGFFGLALFLLQFFLVFLQNHWFLDLFLIHLGLSLSTEDFLLRQQGVTPIVLFYSFFVMYAYFSKKNS